MHTAAQQLNRVRGRPWGEVQDVVAAADYARTKLAAADVHLLGYSFGACVAGAALDARAFISTYTAVAYPLGHWWWGLGQDEQWLPRRH